MNDILTKVIKREITELKKIDIENQNVHWKIKIMYYGAVQDHQALERELSIIDRANLSDFDFAMLDHYKGLVILSKGEIEKARELLFCSFTYLDSKRVRHVVTDDEYGLEYKAMIMTDLATAYIRGSNYSMAKGLLERAINIFYVKRKNNNRAHFCMFKLSFIQMRFNDLWQAKVNFRNVERSKIDGLVDFARVNLIYLYIQLGDYFNAEKVEKILAKSYENLTTTSKCYYLLSKSLLNSRRGYAITEEEEKISKLREDFNGDEINHIINVQLIIAKKIIDDETIKYLREEALKYFIENIMMHYAIQIIKYLEREGY